MNDMIQKIVDFAKAWNLHLDVNYNSRWAGHRAHCIGIPTKQQAKRKIWRSFFWIRPKEDRLCFYAPMTPSAAELTKSYGLDLEDLNLDGLPENTTALCAKMSQVDFDNWTHRDFIQYILNTRAQYCGKELRMTLSGPTGGCG